MEQIKLVIWDLDDTFWHGTLSEGAVSAVKENIELVTTLAKRGIISSICSKNDYEAAKHRLQEMGVWNMFVFPSISWSAKGESVKHIIDAAQLRAPNVLFIDDNTSNIAEVEHFNPGINTMLATANLSTILNSEALKGKNDSSLSRLKQYKILEQKAKFRQTCTDNSEFLRRSDIRIEFIYDTQSLEDRIIELANRSNQLNYTKRRFSEGEHLPDAANIEQAAVHVVDNFGDYGICGYYAVEHNTGSDSDTRDKLLHFFFSCRALNLGIENYVYQKLGCPHLDIVEPVATKLEPDKKIDYIREVSSTQHTKISTTHTQSQSQKKRLMIVGGCDLEQACHYIDKSKFALITHFNFMGDRNIGIFRDHPVYFRQVGQLTDEELSEMRRIPYWSANMLNDDILHGDYDIIVYSVLKVYDSLIYRNRKNGRLLVRPSSNILERTSPGDLTQEEWEYFKQTYECIGMTSEEQFYDDLNFILQTTGRPIIFINGAEVDADLYKGNASLSRYKDMNAVLDRFVSEHADRCSLIDMRKLVTSSTDITDTVQHYGRLTYVSIAEQIMKMSGREVHYSRLRVFLHSHLHTLLWHFGYFKGIRRKLRRLFKHNDTAN